MVRMTISLESTFAGVMSTDEWIASLAARDNIFSANPRAVAGRHYLSY